MRIDRLGANALRRARRKAIARLDGCKTRLTDGDSTIPERELDESIATGGAKDQSQE